MTKIILNQTVAKLGVAGDIIDVKPGFARNYLLPQNFGVLWTKRAGEQAELRKAAARRRAIATLEDAKAIKEKLESATLIVPAKAGANGKLFGAITGAHIAEAAKEAYGVNIDKRKVVLDGVIKSVGGALATVHLLDDTDAKLKINVVARKK